MPTLWISTWIWGLILKLELQDRQPESAFDYTPKTDSVQGGTDDPKSNGANPSPMSELNPDGTQQLQPVTVEKPEPFAAQLGLEDEIPDIADSLAPKFIPGQAQLSADAIRSRTKRIFQKRANGTKKVSEEIWNDWHSKGPKKRVLEEIFKRCGYDPEPRLNCDIFF